MCETIALIQLCFLINTTQIATDASEWTIYITNDNCPDYTWGYTEEQTRQSFADVVKSHLDEMNLTDSEKPENQDRYNMAVTQEAICFMEKYPERKDELIRRIKEGRVYISPYLCNSLWAFQSFESAIRTFYPARRLEKEWGIQFDVAEHIEEPSLPWGVVSILAGCGIKWLSNPFYAYDSMFRDLKNPPVFIMEGIDGSTIKVVMDPYACENSHYTQGKKILDKPETIASEWIPHYGQYLQRAILASGTHGDISPHSGSQTHGFANAIINYNNMAGNHPKLVNASLPQFCSAIDEIETKTPFLTKIGGCFGHSWDVWTVSLAKYVADMREGDRKFVSAESLLSMACHINPKLKEETRPDRERAEWCLAMLSDHAWNGTDDNNKRHNADLRRKWSEELSYIGDKLIQKSWNCLISKKDEGHITLFNSLSFPRSELVRMELSDKTKTPDNSQIVQENGKDYAYLVSDELSGFGFQNIATDPINEDKQASDKLKATDLELESPYYHLEIDPNTSGISSLIHKPTGTEIVVKGNNSLCQTTYFDGTEHIMQDFKSEIIAIGEVMARMKVSGSINSIDVTNYVTVYADLDRVDFDIHINKPITAREEQLCQIFPVVQKDMTLRIETTGAVIRPKPQPEGDLLPGADTRRFAVQGFIDASNNDIGVSITPLDSFLLRLDLGQITFEAIGNDQNYREVTNDQNGVTDFRFRYSLQVHKGEYNGARAFAWSRSVANPLMYAIGSINKSVNTSIDIPSERAISTCFKPAEDDGYIIRLWETSGQSNAINIGINGYKQATQTDLLERNQENLDIKDGNVNLNVRAYGFASLRIKN